MMVLKIRHLRSSVALAASFFAPGAKRLSKEMLRRMSSTDNSLYISCGYLNIIPSRARDAAYLRRGLPCLQRPDSCGANSLSSRLVTCSALPILMTVAGQSQQRVTRTRCKDPSPRRTRALTAARRG